MKKYIALAVIGFAVSANAQTVNFTNSCNYKISLQGVNVTKLYPKDDESGDWTAHGIVTYTLPAQPTGGVAGITIRPVDSALNFNMSIYITAAEVAAKSGSNELVRVNKVLKDKVRTLGSNLKAELAQ